MKISVFITSYNQKQYLIEAIESVLAQTLSANQIIIVDDCSTDGSKEVISGYASRYPNLITPVFHEQNVGVAQTRIDALNSVTGDYVTYVDGDDRFLPTKLEKEVPLLNKRPQAKIVFSNNYYMTADGVHTGVWANDVQPAEGDVFCETFAREFPRRNLFRNELVEYEAWRKVGFHDPRLELYEDFDMRIRLTKKYRVAYHDEPLSEYRIHSTGLSSLEAVRHLKALEYICRKNVPLLRDLSVDRRKHVRKKLGEWIAKVAKRAAKEALVEGNYEYSVRREALKYFLDSMKYNPKSFDYRFLLQILFPTSLYNSLSSGTRALRHVKRTIPGID